MKAQQKQNSSYTWNSILSAKDLMEKGLIWKVGNGMNIRVWEDRWIPNLIDEKIPMRPNPEDDASLTAYELIDQHQRQWRTHAIQGLFPPFVVEAILAIPLSQHPQTDKMMWKYKEDGAYSVKSGYFIALESMTPSEASTSSNNFSCWKNIWQVRVVPKCQNLVWRACKNILPVKANLKKKMEDLDPICTCCGVEEETVTHVFLKCKEVEKIWFGSQLGGRVANYTGSFNDWIETCFRAGDEGLLQQVFGLIWAIWKTRNLWVFERKKTPIQIVLNWSFGVIVTEEAQKCNQEVKHQTTWTAPSQPGFWKVNFDAAIRKGVGTGLGFVCRDREGKMIVAACKLLPQVYKPKIAEALAMRWTLQKANELSFQSFSLESDCAQLVQAWNSEVKSQTSYFQDIIIDSKIVCNNSTPIQLSFVKRTGNRVADLLANLSFIHFENVWTEGLPIQVEHLINADWKRAM